MKICIDAGHNFSGWNTGAVGVNGLKEQNITWEIAERLRVRLERENFGVVMTRKRLTDNLGVSNATSLQKRCELANSHDCDLFISLHCNSGGGNGVETLVYKDKSEAAELAQMIQNKIVGGLVLRNRGVKERPELYVLKHTQMTAVLVELAFIDNAEDADKLVNRQEDFAEEICNAICEYAGKKKIEDSARVKAERIIRERCDNPQKWIELCDTVPWFAEFVCKVRG